MIFVRDIESGEREIVGEFIREEEDVVLYRRDDGATSMAPSDCVVLVRDAHLTSEEFDKWCGEQPQNFNRKRHSIGAVIVTTTDVTNPYRYVREGGAFASGFWRKQALQQFRDRGEGVLGLKLWHAPAGGGAHEITADDVNWSQMEGGRA